MRIGTQKSLKLNFVMNAILTLSTFVFPLITFPYISRILLPEGVGKLNFATSIIAYFNMFAQLGIPTYGIKACAQVRDDREKLTRTTHELLFINLIMTAISYIALIIAIACIPRLRDEKTLYLIVSSTILLSAIGMEWLYKALEEYTYITVRSVAFKLISVIAMFMLVHKQSDYVIYGAISVFASSASFIWNFFKAREYIDFRWMGDYDLKRHLKVVLIFFALACTTTIYTNLDNVMLGFMKTDTDVGLYGAAVKIKTVLVSIITSLGAVLLPRAAYYIEQGNTEEFKNITKKAMQFVILVAVPITVYFMLFAEESIRFIAGDAFAGAVLPMQIIMPTVLFIGITNILGIEIMVPTGREKQVLYSTILGAAVDLILNAILIPRYAAAGAAIGTLAAEFAVLVYQIAVLRKEIKDIFSNIPYVTIIAGTIAAILAAWFTRRFSNSLFITLLLSAGVFFIIYGLINIKTVRNYLENMGIVKKATAFVLDQNKRIQIYLIALSAYTVRYIVQFSTAMKLPGVGLISKAILIITFAVFVFKLILDLYQKQINGRKLIVMLIGILVSGAYIIARGDKGLLVTWLLICASHNVHFDRIAKVVSISVLSSVVLILVFGTAGILESTTIVAWRNAAEFNRNSLGFDYYYNASHLLFYAVVLYSYFRKEKITWIEIGVLTALQIYVFKNTDTKSPFALGIALLVMMALFKAVSNLRKYHPVYGIISTIIHPLCAAGIILLSLVFNWDNALYVKINEIVSSRLNLGNIAFNDYGISLFGQNVEMSIFENYFVIDSSYVCALIERGLLFFVCLMLIFMATGWASRKNKDSYFMLATTVIAIHGTFDGHLYDVPLNMFLIFMAYIYMRPSEDKIITTT